jgi:succinate dehydrogenase / fumarate reductase, cytochrome b subunit
MPLTRKVPVRQALRYKGRSNMLSWILHRITGLGMLVFVGTHVIAAFFLQQIGSDLAVTLTALYESWAFQIVVYFCVLYHALHGTRVALMDLFPKMMRFDQQLLWLQWILFLPLYGLPVYFLVQSALA